MSTQPTQSVLDLIRQGERKKIPLIEALAATQLNRENMGEFVAAMNELGGPLGAELIAKAWPDLDAECRLRVFHDWLDRKDKDQQAGGCHALAAKLLAVDPDSSMDLLDRVHKFAANSPACLKRVLSTTRTEWVTTMPAHSKLRAIDILRLNTPGRVALLDWISDSCAADQSASDNDRRKAELQRETLVRTSIVTAWLSGLRSEQLPEPIAIAVERNLEKLSPRNAIPSALTSTEEPGTEPPPALGAPPVTPAKDNKPANEVGEEQNEMLREVFKSIQQLFKRQSDQHAREARRNAAELETLRHASERAERDASESRDVNRRLVEQIAHLEEHVGALQEAQTRTDTELSAARAKVDILAMELERERREKQALRDESHEAVARETQRERERMLVQLGQRLGNIVDGYREIRSRGPLPEGASAMVGDMMDELLSTLDRAGVKIKRG